LNEAPIKNVNLGKKKTNLRSAIPYAKLNKIGGLASKGRILKNKCMSGA
jgi:hypothetical protein